MQTLPTNEEFSELVPIASAAFREALVYAAEQAKNPSKVWRYYAFPSLHIQSNGMPSMGEVPYGDAPVDYAKIFQGPTILSGFQFTPERFPAVATLFDWMRGNQKFASYFSTPWGKGQFADYSVEQMLSEMISRYIHRFRTTEFSEHLFLKVFFPVLEAICIPQLRLSIAVPIAITPFDFDHLRIAPDCYIMRMRRPFQLARSKATFYGSGAHSSVMAAATHAFVSRDWTLANGETYYSTNRTLHRPTAYPAEYINKFFAALRLVTGRETGYAQMLFVCATTIVVPGGRRLA